jgi:hypothetical protein
VGVHALHPRTYSAIDEEILAQERESIQEDRRGINLKIFAAESCHLALYRMAALVLYRIATLMLR